MALLISTFGYVGFFPIAPGTAGSFVALALYTLMRWIDVPVVELAAIGAVFAVGVWAATRSETCSAAPTRGPSSSTKCWGC